MSTKERILVVAEAEFSKLGYDAVSMNNLVKKLDINKATIYYHFKDKQALYHEILKNLIIDLITSVEKVVNLDLDGESLFKAYIEAIVLFIKKRPSVVAISQRELANYGANIDESIVFYLNKELEYLEKIISKLDLKDEYKNINSYLIFSLIYGTIRDFYAIQMSPLPIGGDDKLKQNSEETLNLISEFVSNIILNAITKNRKKNEL